MFKSTFVKYTVAFAVILIVSFVLLSGIITSTVRQHIYGENIAKLENTASAVSNHLSATMHVEDLENSIASGYTVMMLTPMINMDKTLDIIIADEDGLTLLTTVNAPDGEQGKRPITGGNLGSIVIDAFEGYENDRGEKYYSYEGNVDGVDGVSRLIGKEVITNGKFCGYVFVLTDIESETALYNSVRRAIVTASIWIMLAAVVAVYIITERIIHPLKSMKKAAKSFADGDFSARVTAYGQDEIAELGKAFNNMAESLDNFEKMRNSFLASVSHDLRTPMTTISGFIDGITSGAIPEEKHEYYLGIISSEVHRLSRLVSDLLDISRLESGERKFNFESFDIAEVARIILISFEQKIEEKRLDIIFESDDDNMLVYADRDAIHQVLYNLCHNAIKFSKQGGKLAISITRAKDRRIRISVYDEGEGISREELPLVFDRFYKTDKSRGLDKNGIGLGLYICKTIVDAHGERIHAESPSENGAEFWFTLKEGELSQRRRPSLGDRND